ncbi:inner membrane efflux transporter of RND familymultidrug efflux pump [Striga asiatica]|uniref:Inner membrane efflux transporter of RND familymultidrug efflux pump n=1 Tax=Striga asiatica TaxID=4170 RepID=A0A5A7R437_STRAF|nr:inner membrane efflux transporter of RND familymultidrug efflux pump [Striga asiatica]
MLKNCPKRKDKGKKRVDEFSYEANVASQGECSDDAESALAVSTSKSGDEKTVIRVRSESTVKEFYGFRGSPLPNHNSSGKTKRFHIALLLSTVLEEDVFNLESVLYPIPPTLQKSFWRQRMDTGEKSTDPTKNRLEVEAKEVCKAVKDGNKMHNLTSGPVTPCIIKERVINKHHPIIPTQPNTPRITYRINNAGFGKFQFRNLNQFREKIFLSPIFSAIGIWVRAFRRARVLFSSAKYVSYGDG